MSKKVKSIVEHRFYELPPDIPAILLDGDKWYISDKKSSRMHFHNCDEIGFCHSGKGTIEFNNGATMEFNAGDCTFIPHYLSHTTYSDSGSRSLWSYIFIDFSTLLSAGFLQIPENKHPAFDDVYRNNCVISRDKHPEVFALCQLMLSEIKERRDDWSLVFKYYASAMFFLIRRMYQKLQAVNQLGEHATEHSYEIKMALQYIQNHYTEKLKVSDLASLCHISENHFRRLFLAAMGISPISYLNLVRINQACILLNASNQSILNIADSTGFQSIASFNRNFKEIIGISPREYRHQLTTKSDSLVNQRLVRTYNGWTEAEVNPL